MKRNTKIILALSLIAFIAIASFGLSIFPLGFDEMRLRAKSLTVGNQTVTGSQGLLELDADGDLRYVPSGLFGYYEGYQYPTVRFTVEYSGTSAPTWFDNITVEKQINETHTEVTKVAIWEYRFNARVRLIPQNDVVIGVRSAFEGNGPGEWHGVVFQFNAVVEVELQPFEGREDRIIGITWMQYSSDGIDINWRRWGTMTETPVCIAYEPEMDVSTVGAVWGSMQGANTVLGKTLPMVATISIVGQARAGCYALYEQSLIPGRLYQYVDCSPEVVITIILHVAGENLFIEGQDTPPPDGDPDPPEPWFIPWYLVIFIAVFLLLTAIFAVPRWIKARRK